MIRGTGRTDASIVIRRAHRRRVRHRTRIHIALLERVVRCGGDRLPGCQRARSSRPGSERDRRQSRQRVADHDFGERRLPRVRHGERVDHDVSRAPGAARSERTRLGETDRAEQHRRAVIVLREEIAHDRPGCGLGRRHVARRRRRGRRAGVGRRLQGRESQGAEVASAVGLVVGHDDVAQGSRTGVRDADRERRELP